MRFNTIKILDNIGYGIILFTFFLASVLVTMSLVVGIMWINNHIPLSEGQKMERLRIIGGVCNGRGGNITNKGNTVNCK